MTLTRPLRSALIGAGSALLGIALLPSLARSQDLTVEKVAADLAHPTYVCSAPGHDGLFILERAGTIRILRDGQVLATPFLDVSTSVAAFGEAGLLGLAFHPDYEANGRFFIYYTDLQINVVLAEYKVSANPDVADPAPVQDIFFRATTGAPAHVGGCIRFGPDGKLYVGVGDNFQDAFAQDGSEYRGKILRLDVDLPAPFIPADNPFVGNPAFAPEVWAMGLRNPWRFSFDSRTGDLWINDVGDHFREEVNFQPASSAGGENYGWPLKEGGICWNMPCPPGLTDPVRDMPHNVSGTVAATVGGHVYRGSAIPSLRGTYVHGDFGGTMWSFEWDGTQTSNHRNLTSELDPPGADTIDQIISLGEDGEGELYIVTRRMGVGDVYKIIGEPCITETFCAAAPNSAGPSALIDRQGSTSLTANDFELTVDGAPAGSFGLFYYGTVPLHDVPFGDGFRCLGGRVYRLNPLQTVDANGRVVRAVDTQTLPGAVQAGSAVHFQFWYQDPGGPGGSGFNLSNGLTARFCP